MLYIPSDDDLYKLALDTPALYQALSFHRGGHCSLDDALRLTVAALAAQLKHANDSLIDLHNRSTQPAIFPKRPA